MENPDSLMDRIANKEQVQVVLDNSICVIHQDIVIEAEECKDCEGVFCKPCIGTWIKQFKENRCPNCKKTPFTCQPVGRKFRNSLSAMKFFCENKPIGCEEVISYDNVLEHKKNCKFNLKECPGCNKKIPAVDFDFHYYDDCKDAIKLLYLQQKDAREMAEINCNAYQTQVHSYTHQVKTLEEKVKLLTMENSGLQKSLLEERAKVKEYEVKIQDLMKMIAEKNLVQQSPVSTMHNPPAQLPQNNADEKEESKEEIIAKNNAISKVPGFLIYAGEKTLEKYDFENEVPSTEFKGLGNMFIHAVPC